MVFTQNYTFFIRNWFVRNALVLCSRKIMKLSYINVSKNEYIDLLPLVKLYDFSLEKTVTCYFDQL